MYNITIYIYIIGLTLMYIKNQKWKIQKTKNGE